MNISATVQKLIPHLYLFLPGHQLQQRFQATEQLSGKWAPPSLTDWKNISLPSQARGGQAPRSGLQNESQVLKKLGETVLPGDAHGVIFSRSPEKDCHLSEDRE